MIYIYFILKIYRFVQNITFVSAFEVFPLVVICRWGFCVLFCIIFLYLLIIIFCSHELSCDLGTVMFGEEAVKDGLIHQLGGPSDSLAKLYEPIELEG